MKIDKYINKFTPERTFLVSDLHFGHKNILKYEKIRGEKFTDTKQMDSFIVERWNSVIGENDLVILLGDISLSSKESKYRFGELNGTILLCLGNHDNENTDFYKQFGNIKLVSCLLEYDKFVMTHVPIHPNELEIGRWKKNIHGHTHSRVISDSRYINVSFDYLGLNFLRFSDLLNE